MNVKRVAAITGGIVVAGVAIVLAIAATKPDEVHVERSMTIAATPEQIHQHINNYRNWTSWSPWEKMDPTMQRTYSGPESGKGAKYTWVGNAEVGEGDMEILESTPSKIDINLHFVKPFEATDKATFTMVPEAGATKVTWAMDGHNTFLCKVAQVFMSMDDVCGKEFEKGLASLKTVSETPSQPTASKNQTSL